MPFSTYTRSSFNFVFAKGGFVFPPVTQNARLGEEMKNKRYSLSFWILQVTGWLLFAYLVYAQGVTAFGYHIGVRMGTQEPVETITEVGAAFWYGFALGDLLTYIPLLLAGLIGHFHDRAWGRMLFAAALGITLYWPIVCLITVVDARDASGWSIPDETPYWIVLPLIALWGAWGLWVLMRESQKMQTSAEPAPGVTSSAQEG